MLTLDQFELLHMYAHSNGSVDLNYLTWSEHVYALPPTTQHLSTFRVLSYVSLILHVKQKKDIHLLRSHVCVWSIELALLTFNPVEVTSKEACF